MSKIKILLCLTIWMLSISKGIAESSDIDIIDHYKNVEWIDNINMKLYWSLRKYLDCQQHYNSVLSRLIGLKSKRKYFKRRNTLENKIEMLFGKRHSIYKRNNLKIKKFRNENQLIRKCLKNNFKEIYEILKRKIINQYHYKLINRRIRFMKRLIHHSKIRNYQIILRKMNNLKKLLRKIQRSNGLKSLKIKRYYKNGKVIKKKMLKRYLKLLPRKKISKRKFRNDDYKNLFRKHLKFIVNVIGNRFDKEIENKQSISNNRKGNEKSLYSQRSKERKYKQENLKNHPIKSFRKKYDQKFMLKYFHRKSNLKKIISELKDLKRLNKLYQYKIENRSYKNDKMIINGKENVKKRNYRNRKSNIIKRKTIINNKTKRNSSNISNNKMRKKLKKIFIKSILRKIKIEKLKQKRRINRLIKEMKILKRQNRRYLNKMKNKNILKHRNRLRKFIKIYSKNKKRIQRIKQQIKTNLSKAIKVNFRNLSTQIFKEIKTSKILKRRQNKTIRNRLKLFLNKSRSKKERKATDEKKKIYLKRILRYLWKNKDQLLQNRKRSNKIDNEKLKQTINRRNRRFYYRNRKIKKTRTNRIKKERQNCLINMKRQNIMKRRKHQKTKIVYRKEMRKYKNKINKNKSNIKHHKYSKHTKRQQKRKYFRKDEINGKLKNMIIRHKIKSKKNQSFKEKKIPRNHEYNNENQNRIRRNRKRRKYRNNFKNKETFITKNERKIYHKINKQKSRKYSQKFKEKKIKYQNGKKTNKSHKIVKQIKISKILKHQYRKLSKKNKRSQYVKKHNQNNQNQAFHQGKSNRKIKTIRQRKSKIKNHQKIIKNKITIKNKYYQKNMKKINKSNIKIDKNQKLKSKKYEKKIEIIKQRKPEIKNHQKIIKNKITIKNKYYQKDMKKIKSNIKINKNKMLKTEKYKKKMEIIKQKKSEIKNSNKIINNKIIIKNKSNKSNGKVKKIVNSGKHKTISKYRKFGIKVVKKNRKTKFVSNQQINSKIISQRNSGKINTKHIIKSLNNKAFHIKNKLRSFQSLTKVIKSNLKNLNKKQQNMFRNNEKTKYRNKKNKFVIDLQKTSLKISSETRKLFQTKIKIIKEKLKSRKIFNKRFVKEIKSIDKNVDKLKNYVENLKNVVNERLKRGIYLKRRKSLSKSKHFDEKSFERIKKALQISKSKEMDIKKQMKNLDIKEIIANSKGKSRKVIKTKINMINHSVNKLNKNENKYQSKLSKTKEKKSKNYNEIKIKNRIKNTKMQIGDSQLKVTKEKKIINKVLVTHENKRKKFNKNINNNIIDKSHSQSNNNQKTERKEITSKVMIKDIETKFEEISDVEYMIEESIKEESTLYKTVYQNIK